jgi:hypothetical protein
VRETVTVKTGQKALFDKKTGEILDNIPQKISYNVYGVEVPTEISLPVVSLGEGGMARENVVVTYTLLPEGVSPAGYVAASAYIDLFSVDSTGEESWEDFLVGNAATGRSISSRRCSIVVPMQRFGGSASPCPHFSQISISTATTTQGGSLMASTTCRSGILWRTRLKISPSGRARY